MTDTEAPTERRTVVYRDDKYQITHITGRVEAWDDASSNTLPPATLREPLPDMWHLAYAGEWAGHSIGLFPTLLAAVAAMQQDRPA